MRALTLVLCLSAVAAFAWGPVAEGGVVAVGIPSARNARVFGGSNVSLGLEFGDRFNHELAVEYLSLTGLGREPATAEGLAARYTFSVDFLGKQGFTPTIGIGASVGRFVAQSPGDSVGGFFVAARALAGVRYTFDFGLSLKALVAVNLYGLNVSVTPTAGVAWRF